MSYVVSSSWYEEGSEVPPFKSGPNTLFCGQPIMISEDRIDEDTPEIKKRERYINKCKDAP